MLDLHRVAVPGHSGGAKRRVGGARVRLGAVGTDVPPVPTFPYVFGGCYGG
jgi:hypothetical protein